MRPGKAYRDRRTFTSTLRLLGSCYKPSCYKVIQHKVWAGDNGSFIFGFFVVVIVLKDYRKVLTFVLMQNIILIAFKTQQNHKKLINKSADSCI